MVQFAEVLSQVRSEHESAPPVRGVRVNTAGWDSWLKAEEAPAPSPGNFYLDAEADAEVREAEDAAPAEGTTAAGPIREEILRSDYAGPAATPDIQLQESPAYRPEPLDLARELARQRLENLDETQLRALRRRLARRVHPDLPSADAPDSHAMVRVNVAIDAALRERRHGRRPS